MNSFDANGGRSIPSCGQALCSGILYSAGHCGKFSCGLYWTLILWSFRHSSSDLVGVFLSNHYPSGKFKFPENHHLYMKISFYFHSEFAALFSKPCKSCCFFGPPRWASQQHLNQRHLDPYPFYQSWVSVRFLNHFLTHLLAGGWFSEFIRPILVDLSFLFWELSHPQTVKFVEPAILRLKCCFQKKVWLFLHILFTLSC